MRLLSEYETAILKGDLSKIKLPDTAAIYLSTGIPQVFQRVDSNEEDFVEDPWLYVPASRLNSIRQQMIVNSNNKISRYFDNEPVETEDLMLYPLLINGEIKIIIVDSSKKKIKIKPDTVESIVETLEIYQKNQHISENHLDHFILTLFNNHESVDKFIKNLLDLLVRRIPNSCAGYYFDDQGIIKLRMTVGDLRRFDLLPSFLSDNIKQEWIEALQTKTHFIPAESLEDEIGLLDSPPDFIYVHEGLQSEYVKNLLCFILYGDISESAIQLLDKITSLVAKLHEKQFIDAHSINKYYERNLLKIKNTNIMHHLLKELIILLDKQMIISRIVFKEEYKEAVVVKKEYNGEFAVYEHSMVTIDDTIQNHVKAQHKYFIEDITRAEYEEQTVKDCYESNVSSEYFFRISLPENKEAIISIGSPITGRYLDSVGEFLSAAVMAFVNCLRFQKSQKALESVSINEDILNSRIDLFGKLIGGYFFHIFSKLTVIIGAAERFVHTVHQAVSLGDKTKMISYAEKLKDYADEVTDDIKMIRLIIPNTSDDYSRTISCEAFIKKLPKYINGYLKHIKDTKNIDINLENNSISKLDFKITGEEIVDIVLPLLVELMNSFEDHGKIKVMTQSELDMDRIDFSFDEAVIRSQNITDIIENSFQISRLLRSKKNMYKIKDIVLKYMTDADDIVHIQIIKKSALFTGESVRVQNSLGVK